MKYSQHVPLAAHSYFRILNKKDVKNSFLLSRDSEPQFEYPKVFSTAELQNRKQHFLEAERLQSYKFILLAAKLQSEVSELERFRKLNTKLYGIPSSDLMLQLMKKFLDRCDEYGSSHGEYVKKRVTVTYPHSNKPALGKSFEHYRAHYERYLSEKGVEFTGNLEEMLSGVMSQLGLYELGWRLILRNDDSHARVSHARRAVLLGRDYTPRSQQAKKHIVVHEVFGHVIRGEQRSINESEGFAIVLEQLTGPRFKFRRSYRYLAAALGWGVDGKPRSFREVFEILWRVMAVMSKYSDDVARSHAFDECTRIFRGGKPEIPGAVYLKDTLYLGANYDMWRTLDEKRLDYNQFIEVVEGRATVL